MPARLDLAEWFEDSPRGGRGVGRGVGVSGRFGLRV